MTLWSHCTWRARWGHPHPWVPRHQRGAAWGVLGRGPRYLQVWGERGFGAAGAGVPPAPTSGWGAAPRCDTRPGGEELLTPC